MKSIVKKAREIVTQLYERNMVSWNDLDREVVFAIQALIAEVQRMEALAQPEQEPVALQERQAKRMQDGVVTEWTSWYPCRYRTIEEARSEASDHIPYEWRPLYTTPPQRKPITDEEINDIAKNYALNNPTTPLHFARAIEAAHGIKE